MDMEIFFPGKMKVNARYGHFEIETDQPVSDGGDGSAPSPFELFVSTLGTCAGYFALSFMTRRGIDTAGAGVRLHADRNSTTHQLEDVSLEIVLPPGFPEKYREAIIRAADQCSVKRALENPPRVTVTATAG